MKKFLTILLVLGIALSAASCKKDDVKKDEGTNTGAPNTTASAADSTETPDDSSSDDTTGEPSTNVPADSTKAPDNTKAPDTTKPAPSTETPATKETDPLKILKAAWDKYDDKFAAIGGDFSEENMVDGDPGKFALGDAESVDRNLGLPAASVDKVDSAASIIHMLNANTFSCGAFHVKNSSDVSGVVDAIKNNLANRRWMCGIPDKLVIVRIDDCLVSFFGNEEIVNNFRGDLMSAYSSATVVCEMPIE